MKDKDNRLFVYAHGSEEDQQKYLCFKPKENRDKKEEINNENNMYSRIRSPKNRK
jgi:hypothetical protein